MLESGKTDRQKDRKTNENRGRKYECKEMRDQHSIQILRQRWPCYAAIIPEYEGETRSKEGKQFEKGSGSYI